MKRTIALAAAMLVAALAAMPALAGDLNPPAGPVAPTMKPLTDVEPRIAVNATNTPGNTTNQFIITQPGSYYLTGNIAGVSGKSGILVASNGVTLDLMGFTMVGVSGPVDGITMTGFFENVVIRNGHTTSTARPSRSSSSHTTTRSRSANTRSNSWSKTAPITRRP